MGAGGTSWPADAGLQTQAYGQERADKGFLAQASGLSAHPPKPNPGGRRHRSKSKICLGDTDFLLAVDY
jgi:hypothetical protein